MDELFVSMSHIFFRWPTQSGAERPTSGWVWLGSSCPVREEAVTPNGGKMSGSNSSKRWTWLARAWIPVLLMLRSFLHAGAGVAEDTVMHLMLPHQPHQVPNYLHVEELGDPGSVERTSFDLAHPVVSSLHKEALVHGGNVECTSSDFYSMDLVLHTRDLFEKDEATLRTIYRKKIHFLLRAALTDWHKKEKNWVTVGQKAHNLYQHQLLPGNVTVLVGIREQVPRKESPWVIWDSKLEKLEKEKEKASLGEKKKHRKHGWWGWWFGKQKEEEQAEEDLGRCGRLVSREALEKSKVLEKQWCQLYDDACTLSLLVMVSRERESKLTFLEAKEIREKRKSWTKEDKKPEKPHQPLNPPFSDPFIYDNVFPFFRLHEATPLPHPPVDIHN